MLDQLLIFPQLSPPLPPFADLYSASLNAGGGQAVSWPLTNIPNLDTTHPLSMSIWINMPAAQGDYAWAFNAGNNSSGILLGVLAATTTPYFQITIGGAGWYVLGSNLPTGTWYHIVGTYDGSDAYTGLKLYINSVLQTPDVDGGAPSPVGASFTKSAIVSVSPSNYYNGLVNEAAIWSTELTQTQVNEIYNSGAPDDLSSLSSYSSIALWAQFQNNWDDSSPNGYPGTPINSPTFSTNVP